jgi:hypothetical protein
MILLASLRASASVMALALPIAYQRDPRPWIEYTHFQAQWPDGCTLSARPRWRVSQYTMTRSGSGLTALMNASDSRGLFGSLRAEVPSRLGLGMFQINHW